MGLFRSSTTATSSSTTAPARSSSIKRTKEDKNVEDKAPSRHLFSKTDHLTLARTKLDTATAAEREADEALTRSRAAVKEALTEIAALEKEAKRETQAAKEKLASATKMKKLGGKLGKH